MLISGIFQVSNAHIFRHEHVSEKICVKGLGWGLGLCMGLAVRSAARVEGVRAEVARCVFECDEGAGEREPCFCCKCANIDAAPMAAVSGWELCMHVPA